MNQSHIHVYPLFSRLRSRTGLCRALNSVSCAIQLIIHLLYMLCVHARSLPLCPTLCDPMDCSPTGSAVHGILQARILLWVAIASSRGPSRPRDGIPVSYVSCIGRQVLYHSSHLRSPSSMYSSVYMFSPNLPINSLLSPPDNSKLAFYICGSIFVL